MSSVDDRIVNMQFNNKQFVSGAAESEKALGALEGALQRTAKSKGLEGMASTVEGVKTRFGAMQVAGVAAVATIASKATSAGINLIKSLTLDPVMQGFKEYQTGLDSIQTIMANTGKSVAVVNKALDQLNQYSDQTIYNFAEMAKNVGTFTAAGVDLKTSVASIKGIANLAALSGSNSQQASTAMYQLSQAIAAGKVGLQDWNSVVNAGMGGKIFQTALARTAVNMKTLGKDSIALVGPMKQLKINGDAFRTSISAAPGQESWLTSDVLVETLKQVSGGYSEAELRAKGYSKAEAEAIVQLQKRAFNAATQIKTLPQLVNVIQESIGSTWSGIFRSVMGDFQQSKKLWGDVGFAIIGPQGFLTKAQNGLENFVKEWVKLGGRNAALDAFKTGFKALGSIFSAVGKAFRDVFPPSQTNVMFELTKTFQSLAHALSPSEATLDNLRKIFGGIFAVLHIGLTIVNGIRAAFVGLLKGIFAGSGEARGGILDLLGSVGEILIAFDKWLTAGGKLTDIMGGVGQVVGAFIKPLISGIGLVVSAIADLATGKGIDAFLSKFTSAESIFSGFTATVRDGLTKILGPLDKFDGIIDPLKDKLQGLQDALDGFLPDMSGIGKAIADGIASGMLGEGISALKNAVVNLATMIPAWIKDVLGIHSPAQEMIPIGFHIVEGIAKGIVSAVGLILHAIGEVVGGIFGAINGVLSNFDPLEVASLMNALFTGALILTLKKFAKDSGGLLSAIRDGITNTFGALTNTLKSMQQAIKARAIRDIAIAVGIMTLSLIALSMIDPKKLAVALGMISGSLGALVGSLYLLSKIQGQFSTATLAASMVLLSTAMVNLAIAITILAQQDPKKVATGLGFMAAALGLMVGAVFAFSKIGPMVEGAAGSILIMSIAMNALATAIGIMGNLDVKTLVKGLSGMAIGLGLFVGVLAAFSKTGVGTEKAAGAIFIMSTAMVILSSAVLALGSMNMKTLAKGLGAMAIALGLMVGALLLLSNFGGQATVAAGAMVLMAVALNALVTVILALGVAPFDVVAKGLGLVAIALGILLLAAAGAMIVAPGLYALGITIGLLGAAMALAGVGMLAFGTGFALMAAAGVAGVAVLIAGFQAFMALLPSFAVQVAAAFVAFVQTIAAASPKLREAFGKIFENILGTIQDAIPKIGNLLIVLVNTAIRVLQSTIPQWVEMGFTLIDKFLKSAEKHIPSIADSAITLVTKFMDTIAKRAPDIVKSGANMIVSFVEALPPAIRDSTERLRNAGVQMAIAVADGMTSGLLTEGARKVREAAESLAGALPSWMKKVLHIASPSKEGVYIGRMVAVGVARGIAQSTGGAVAAAVALANAILREGNVTIAKAQALASNAQKQADIAQARANATARAAKKLQKTDPKRAKKLKAQANQQQKVADAMQARADRASDNVESVRTFENADFREKGDIKSAQAVDLAEKAQKALAEANADAALAKKLRATNAKAAAAMLAESRKHAAQAKSLAAQAQAANAQAQAFYAKSVKEQIAAMEEQNAFEKADAAGKIEILQNRAAAQQAKADAANAQALALLEQAKAISAKDARKAQDLLDQAEQQKQIAEDAANAAEQARNEAVQIAGGGSSSTGGITPTLEPSKSVLEDAAKAVDRYTESLALAEAAAQATPTVMQFEQNNYSPEALTAGEIYRNTKNLLSAQEIKMGAPTP